MTIQITVKDFDELKELANQVLTGGMPLQPHVMAPPEIDQPSSMEQTPKPAQEQEDTAEEAQEEKQEDAPKAEPSADKITLNDLTQLCLKLMDNGGQEALFTLLRKHGVEALPELSEDQYPAFLKDLKDLEETA